MTKFSVVFQMRGSEQVSPVMDIEAPTAVGAQAKASAIIDAVTGPERGDYAITVFSVDSVDTFKNYEV